MKRLLLIFAFVVIVNSTGFSQGKFGFGIIVGEPTGLTGKYKLSQSSSIDGALGWSFNKYGSLHIPADYLHNFAYLSPEVPAYIGIGGRVKTKNDDKKEDLRLAVRVPVGLAYQPISLPIDVFIETVPMLDLSPASEFNWNAAIGFRYYFD